MRVAWKADVLQQAGRHATQCTLPAYCPSDSLRRVPAACQTAPSQLATAKPRASPTLNAATAHFDAQQLLAGGRDALHSSPAVVLQVQRHILRRQVQLHLQLGQKPAGGRAEGVETKWAVSAPRGAARLLAALHTIINSGVRRGGISHRSRGSSPVLAVQAWLMKALASKASSPNALMSVMLSQTVRSGPHEPIDRSQRACSRSSYKMQCACI